MAAVTVTAQNTRLDDAETTTDWVSVGGGVAGGLETDFKYQGSNCYSRKGGTAQRGIGLSDGNGATDTDLTTATGTYQTVMFKVICTTPGLLDLESVPGGQLEIGSGSAGSQSSNRYNYTAFGSDTYPVDKSWLVFAVDPNVAAHRTSTTGTPVLTAVDWYGYSYDQTGASKVENQAMDAVDVGAGLTLVGGDGASADGIWQDFSDHDWGTSTNRFGYVRENEGIFIIYGNMIIGTATATVFNDSAKTIVFSDGLFANGFSAITIDLQNVTTDVDFATSTFIGLGTATGEDTRPILTITGTSGAFDAANCLFDNFSSFSLTSACTFNTCTFLSSGQINATSAGTNGASLVGSSVLTSSVAANSSALLWNINADPDGELDDMIFTKGTNAHHAIEFGTSSPLTMTIRGMTSTGFSASNNVNDSTFHVKRTTGTVTINVINGSGNFSYRTDGATVNIVIDPVTTLVHVVNNLGVDLQNARVYLKASNGTGPLPFEDSVTIARAGTTATVTHTSHGMASNDKVKIQGITDKVEDNLGVHQITVTGTNTYTYTTTDSGSTSYTGTIISTWVALEGLTDVNGDISLSKTYSTNQPVTGFVRKSTSSPRFKSFPITGTINSSVGLTINVRMILDE